MSINFDLVESALEARFEQQWNPAVATPHYRNVQLPGGALPSIGFSVAFVDRDPAAIDRGEWRVDGVLHFVSTTELNTGSGDGLRICQAAAMIFENWAPSSPQILDFRAEEALPDAGNYDGAGRFLRTSSQPFSFTWRS